MYLKWNNTHFRLIEKISRGVGSPDGTVKREVRIVNCGEYEKN